MCCSPPQGRMRGFIRPRLLLQLLQQPAHGYELLERLTQDDSDLPIDTGLLYRTLRQLEDEKLVRSTWDTGEAGPARRLYEVTPDGVACLHEWATHIRQARRRLERFLEDYETFFADEKVKDRDDE